VKPALTFASELVPLYGCMAVSVLKGVRAEKAGAMTLPTSEQAQTPGCSYDPMNA
jgi:hypothetical protein